MHDEDYLPPAPEIRETGMGAFLKGLFLEQLPKYTQGKAGLEEAQFMDSTSRAFGVPGKLYLYCVEDTDDARRLRGWYYESDPKTGKRVRRSMRFGGMNLQEQEGFRELVELRNREFVLPEKPNKADLLQELKALWAELRFVACTMGFNFHGFRFVKMHRSSMVLEAPAWPEGNCPNVRLDALAGRALSDRDLLQLSKVARTIARDCYRNSPKVAFDRLSHIILMFTAFLKERIVSEYIERHGPMVEKLQWYEHRFSESIEWVSKNNPQAGRNLRRLHRLHQRELAMMKARARLGLTQMQRESSQQSWQDFLADALSPLDLQEYAPTPAKPDELQHTARAII